MSLTKYQELERLVLFITDKLNITKKTETRINMNETSKCVEFEIKTRLESYTHMSHMDATDDLCGTLEYWEENLPEQLQGIADDIGGEVGEKGYITITVTKYF